ncbi:MAG: SAM-dependent chlorinase/fluorinase [Methanosarcinales archaeon]|nr:SAM-dependent chlorinase/fluorinase [Methanosarcinales archaeon]
MAENRVTICRALFFLALAILSGCLGDREEAVGEGEGNAGAIGLVAVLTDYGTSGFAAGSLVGAIYSANPSARVATITHQVSPFDVAEGSYILAAAAKEFPPGTVFVAGVDPGVGTRRRSIVLVTSDGKTFVGPDNGIFTGVMDKLGVERVYEIENSDLLRPGTVSTSFHGRDIYGPVAAHLSAGMKASVVGPEIWDPVRLPVTSPAMTGQGIQGSVVNIDNFGNLMTNIPGQLLDQAGLKQGNVLIVTVGNRSNIMSFASTYGDVQEGAWVTFVSAEGTVEIARNQASAAGDLGARVGDGVWMTGVQRNTGD